LFATAFNFNKPFGLTDRCCHKANNRKRTEVKNFGLTILEEEEEKEAQENQWNNFAVSKLILLH